MLWYNTAGCPEKFAFRAGPSLTSGFEQCGLFPFNPDVIRDTVKAHHGRDSPDRLLTENEQPDFSVIVNELETKVGISSEKDLNSIKEYIVKSKRGVTPGAELAMAVRSSLLLKAPQKQRRVKNSYLSTECGALITSKEFELARDKHNEEMKSKRATRTKKRKVVEPDQASDSDQEQRIEPVVKLSARKTVPRKRK